MQPSGDRLESTVVERRLIGRMFSVRFPDERAQVLSVGVEQLHDGSVVEDYAHGIVRKVERLIGVWRGRKHPRVETLWRRIRRYKCEALGLRTAVALVKTAALIGRERLARVSRIRDADRIPRVGHQQWTRAAGVEGAFDRVDFGGTHAVIMLLARYIRGTEQLNDAHQKRRRHFTHGPLVNVDFESRCSVGRSVCDKKLRKRRLTHMEEGQHLADIKRPRACGRRPLRRQISGAEDRYWG
jgi:hypothetical protein